MRTSGFAIACFRSAATRSAAPGDLGILREANILGETVGVLRAESEEQRRAFRAGGEHGELRDGAVFVFDLHVEVVTLKKRRGNLEHARQLFRA